MTSAARRAEAPAPASPNRRPVGRPRDPKIDWLVRVAAAEHYVAEGWAGFNFEAVGRRAGVGKSAIYRRWNSREDLLVDAINRVDYRSAIDDAPTLRAACLAGARLHLAWWGDVTGEAYLRMQADQTAHPFLGELYQKRVIVPLVRAFRKQVRRAVESGEVPAGTSATLLVEALYGTTLVRMTAMPGGQRKRFLTNPEAYLERLVDFVMGGAIAAAMTCHRGSPAAPASRRPRTRVSAG